MKLLSVLFFLWISITYCSSMQLIIFDQSSFLDDKECLEDTKISFNELYKKTPDDLRKKFFEEITGMSTSIVIAKSDDEYLATVFFGFDEPETTTMLFMFTYRQEKSTQEITAALNTILEHIKSKYQKIKVACLILKEAAPESADFIKRIGFEYTITENPDGKYGGWDQYELLIDSSTLNNND